MAGSSITKVGEHAQGKRSLIIAEGPGTLTISSYDRRFDSMLKAPILLLLGAGLVVLPFEKPWLTGDYFDLPTIILAPLGLFFMGLGLRLLLGRRTTVIDRQNHPVRDRQSAGPRTRR